MSTFDLPINAVTAEVLERLKNERVKENLRLEYKESLPDGKSREKFLSSITAFANTSGGDLIYGIRAKRDDDNVPTGEPDSVVGLNGVNLDQETLRLQQWIRDCIEPSVPVIMEVISRGAEPPCLLVRVPRSWSALHMIKTMDNPFYGRHSGGKHPLALNEIRAGFMLGETARDRVRHFRSDRVARLQNGESPTNVGLGPKIIFHALPLAPNQDAWERFRDLERDAAVIKDGVLIVLRLQLIYGDIQDWHYNTDGFLVKTLQPHNSYAQLFHDCGIEAVDGWLLQFQGLDSRNDDLKVMHGVNIERGVINALRAYQQFWTRVGSTGPIALFLTLTGIKNCGLVTKSSHIDRSRFVGFDRDCLMTSDVVMEDLTVSPDRILKPLFDFIWNGSGYPESPHYKNGSWVGDVVA